MNRAVNRPLGVLNAPPGEGQDQARKPPDSRHGAAPSPPLQLTAGASERDSDRLTNVEPKSNLCPLIRPSCNTIASPWRGRSRSALLRPSANGLKTDNLLQLEFVLLLCGGWGVLCYLPLTTTYAPNPIQQEPSSSTVAFAPYTSCIQTYKFEHHRVTIAPAM